MYFSLRRKYRKLAVIFCFVLVLFVLYEFSTEESPIEDPGNEKIKRKSVVHRRRCESFRVRQQICQDYLSNNVGGNFCHDLCTKQSIYFEPFCASAKPTTIILFGKWMNKNIVLKTKASSHDFKDLDSELSYVHQLKDPFRHINQYQEIFTNHIYNYITQEISTDDLLHHISPTKMLQLMYHPHVTTKLSITEMRSLWTIVQQEEFIKLRLLQENKHFPQIYGFCGKYYAMERVKSLGDFTNLLTLPLPWFKRVGIALDLLDTINDLKQTFIGRLSHCDVQPGNFGLGQDGRVVALDIDTVFTQSQMNIYMAQGNCTSNSDCSFFDCISECVDGKCSGKMVTNNLFVLCRDLFIGGFGNFGLLSIPSVKIPKYLQLKRYLNHCADASKLPWSVEMESKLFKNIYHLLIEVQRMHGISIKDKKDNLKIV